MRLNKLINLVLQIISIIFVFTPHGHYVLRLVSPGLASLSVHSSQFRTNRTKCLNTAFYRRTDFPPWLRRKMCLLVMVVTLLNILYILCILRVIRCTRYTIFGNKAKLMRYMAVKRGSLEERKATTIPTYLPSIHRVFMASGGRRTTAHQISRRQIRGFGYFG